MERGREIDEAGRRGELLAADGDREGALRTWAQAYGDIAPTTKRLAEVLAEDGDLDDAVSTWTFSDALRDNPLGRHQAYLNSLSEEGRQEATYDDPDDWGYLESERLAGLLAERGDDAAVAELRARAADGDGPARAALAGLEPPDRPTP